MTREGDFNVDIKYLLWKYSLGIIRSIILSSNEIEKKRSFLIINRGLIVVYVK